MRRSSLVLADRKGQEYLLPADYFRPAELSAEKREEYVELCKELVHRAHIVYKEDRENKRDASTDDGRERRDTSPGIVEPEWRWCGDKRGISLFRSKTPDGRTGDIVRAVGKIYGTIDEVMGLLIQETTAEFRQVSRKLNPVFLDGIVLHTIIPRTEEHPHRYMGIKWFAVRSAGLGMRPRDYCVLEYVDVMSDVSGGVCGFKVMTSIETPDCPSLEATHNLVRAKVDFQSVRYNTTKQAGVLKVTYTARMDNGGGLFPQRSSLRLLEREANAIPLLGEFIDRERISQLQFVDVSQWEPDGERNFCRVCKRRFSTLLRHHHCRSCGELVCGKCSFYYRADLPVVGLQKVRLCSLCVCESRLQHDQYAVPHKQKLTVADLKKDPSVMNQVMVLADQLSMEFQNQNPGHTLDIAFIYTGSYARFARKIILTGSFCGYRTDPDFGAILLKKTGDTKWEAEVSLRPGRYTYRLYIDGHLWAYDDSDINATVVRDPKGEYHTVLHVGADNDRSSSFSDLSFGEDEFR